MNSINWEVKTLLESNKKDTELKEKITKEFDAIEVPEGLKEELWTQIDGKRKKNIFISKVIPYIVAAAAIAIFIPLVLSILSTTDMASNELAGKTFDIRVLGDLTSPGDLDTIETFEFSSDNTFENTKGNIAGNYELTDDNLWLLIEDENEKLEIKFTLEESDRVVDGYGAELIDVNYDMKDWDQIRKYWNFSNELYQYSYVFFSEK